MSKGQNRITNFLNFTIMKKNELLSKADEAKELLGVDELLEAILRALSADKLEDILIFIDRVYELRLF